MDKQSQRNPQILQEERFFWATFEGFEEIE
jgi:hypothetical protein